MIPYAVNVAAGYFIARAVFWGAIIGWSTFKLGERFDRRK